MKWFKRVAIIAVSLIVAVAAIGLLRAPVWSVEVAEVIEVETMTPGEGQVLIAVQYAGINGGCETFRYVDTLYIHHICISREGIYGCALDPCHFLQGAR